jgi:hypothetical protein
MGRRLVAMWLDLIGVLSSEDDCRRHFVSACASQPTSRCSPVRNGRMGQIQRHANLYDTRFGPICDALLPTLASDGLRRRNAGDARKGGRLAAFLWRRSVFRLREIRSRNLLLLGGRFRIAKNFAGV